MRKPPDFLTAAVLGMGIVLVLAAVRPAAAETAAEKGLRIAVEADTADSGFADTTSEGKMILRNRQGQESIRTFTASVLERTDDGDEGLIVFHKPRDVAGTALLTHSHKTGDDDQWLYLPALKRVKRISSSNKSGAFVGSEFSYEDLASQEVGKYTYKWLRDEACPGGPEFRCFVLDRYPVDKASGYSRQVIWIEQRTYRPYKIDYYDRKDTLLKTLAFSDHKRYLKKYWRSHKMLMQNLQTGKSTELLWGRFDFRTGLSEHDFEPSMLSRIR